jgi:hypothetical protein
MSLPGLAAHGLAAAPAAAAISPLDILLGSLSSHPVFIGLMMLILNLGGRFIVMEVSKEQEQIFQHPWIRRFLIFAVLFVATRNIITALWMTLLVVLILGYLFNENSSLCLFKGGVAGSSCAVPAAAGASAGGSPGMTPEEMDIWRRLNEKYQRYVGTGKKANGKGDEKESEKDVDPKEVYMANMRLIGMAVN